MRGRRPSQRKAVKSIESACSTKRIRRSQRYSPLTDARRGGREQLAFCIARYDLFPHVCTRKHASAKNGLQERPLKKASYLSRVVIGYPFLPGSRKRPPLYLFPSLFPVHRLLHLPSLSTAAEHLTDRNFSGWRGGSGAALSSLLLFSLLSYYSAEALTSPLSPLLLSRRTMKIPCNGDFECCRPATLRLTPSGRSISLDG